MPTTPSTEQATHSFTTPAGAVSVPTHLAAALWRGSELARASDPVIPSGWAALDTELPGGGWPLRSLTEVLAAQPAVLEWRLLGPALKRVAASGSQIVIVAPPRHPHLPGLLHEGLDDRKLIWVQAGPPAERLWVTEQLIRSNAAGAIVAWLPQARQEQIRRLQVSAQGCEGLVVLCRPEAARHEASAAPLRVHAGATLDWALEIDILKRRGPAHVGKLSLPSVPGGLSAVLTPRLRRPSSFIPSREAAVAVGRPVVAAQPRAAAVQ